MTLTQVTWNCAKVMLSLTRPFQAMVQTNRPRNTHHFCNSQAIAILRRDGLRSESFLMQSYLEALNQGSSWCDQGFKNISHYYNHQENTGLWHGPDAPTECQVYFDQSLKYWRKGQREKALFYLGAASHILQDLCVPHHAGGVVLSGHKYFEDWARAHYEEFGMATSGIYGLGDTPSDWVRENARISAVFLPQLAHEVPPVPQVAGLMLLRAQQTTSGFFSYFLNQAHRK